MTDTVPSYEIEQWSRLAVEARIDELAEIYAEVYSEPPYDSGELWSRSVFVDRTRRQARREGFSFLAARVGHQVVGFSFGLPFAEGSWWAGDATEPPAELRAASKFAVIELLVRKRWRRLGIGHQLMNGLLSGRTERYAILTAVPNADARRLYERWGWVQTGTAQHSPESPVLDALALLLPSAAEP
ncbi:GNAT family N-acetyltransferase [Actinoplanes aureus]|uniref:GNAT family N-acetyltransferase n=1 Tax=Actinoplanes aureus TaxID=2792083 RepID=A0A931CMM6_9ACTN|nr:GNAT family N-acetyltransferase [Actinoplanes aureus]